MARIDEKQINKNRVIAADNALETPWNTQIEDCDADFPERLFGPVPTDKVGFMPPVQEMEE